MRLGRGIVLGLLAPALAVVAGCGGSTSNLGATEAQGSATAPRPIGTPEWSRRPGYQANVLALARTNDANRRILYTSPRTQLALMTIPPGGDVGVEAHPHVEQLVFIADGRGKAVLDGAESQIGPGDVVVVTPGTRNDFVNSGAEPLRMYTVYAPLEYFDGGGVH